MFDTEEERTPVFSDEQRLLASTAIYTKDRVYVQLRHRVDGAHGDHLVEDGDPIEVACSVEGRAQQAGMFSISGAEDKTPGSQGGLQEVTPIQILALEWPGDIDSAIWFEGDKYDADGAPVHREHGLVPHYEIRARRVWDHTFAVSNKPEVADGSRTD
nr:hypothetical protein [Bifidobacterium sp. DSM 109959]